MGPFTKSALSVALLASSALSSPVQTIANPEKRSLKPSKFNYANMPRDGRALQPRSMVDLDYIDEDFLDSPTSFGATVHMGTKLPALMLEEMEDLLHRVTCSSSGIKLGFSSSQYAKRAQESWDMPEFIVITSNYGCNKNGERLPYKVSGVSFDGHRGAMLDAKPISWTKASKSMRLEFGNKETKFVRPSNGAITKRQESRESKDFSFSLIDQVLLRDVNVGVAGFTEKCKNCTGQATFTMEAGDIELFDGIGDLFDGIDGNFELSDIAKGANVDITVSNMAARFQFETDIKIFKTFAIPLLGAPVSLIGFQIAGLIAVGPKINPLLVAQIALSEPFKFTYGFDFKVPDGAGMTFDLVDLSKSSTQGFDGTTFEPLPFEVDTPTTGVNFSVAFRPTLSLGITVLDKNFDPVNAFLDVPKFQGTVALVEGVDDTCAPAAGGSDHLSLNTDFVLDVGVGADINLFDVIKVQPAFPLASTTLAPFSTCIALGGGAVGGPATSTVKSGGLAGPTGSAPVPTGTAPISTGTAPIPTGTAPIPTGTAPIYTGPVPTGTAPAPMGTGIAARAASAPEDALWGAGSAKVKRFEQPRRAGWFGVSF